MIGFGIRASGNGHHFLKTGRLEAIAGTRGYWNSLYSGDYRISRWLARLLPM